MGAVHNNLAGYPGKQGMTVADEVINAFNEFTVRDGEVLARFQEGFKKRSRLPELPEADGGADGLSRVLAELLRQTPPVMYLKPESSASAFKDQSFIADFKAALVNVANRYPQTLLLMKKHQHQKNCSLTDLLHALLLDYSANAAAYPY